MIETETLSAIKDFKDQFKRVVSNKNSFSAGNSSKVFYQKFINEKHKQPPGIVRKFLPNQVLRIVHKKNVGRQKSSSLNQQEFDGNKMKIIRRCKLQELNHLEIRTTNLETYVKPQEHYDGNKLHRERTRKIIELRYLERQPIVGIFQRNTSGSSGFQIGVSTERH